MGLLEIERHPSARQLRVFGISGLVASLLAALILHFVWEAATLWTGVVLTAGSGIFLCSLVSRTLTRIIYVGLTLVTMPIGLAVSFMLLTVFYFLMLVPLAVVFRLIGRDALHRKCEPTAETYWVPRKPDESVERWLHQF